MVDDAMATINTTIVNIANFFAQDLIATFPDQSLHIGVIATGDYAFAEPGCDQLGDLLRVTDAGRCEPSNGLRFATEEDNLLVTLPCLMDLEGSGGHAQYPITATIAALSDEKAEPGACNEGFLREGAVLGIFIATAAFPYYDDTMDDTHPETDTSTWYDAILAAKGGDASKVAVLGFIPIGARDCVPESPNLVGFVDAFGEQGLRYDICQDHTGFRSGYADGLELLAQTCAEWSG